MGPVAFHTAAVKPNTSSSSDLPGRPKAEKTEWSRNLHVSPGKGPTLANPDFWPSWFWPIHFWIWSWPKGWGPKPEKTCLDGWGPDGRGPEGWEAQNFALFFFRFALFVSLWVSSRGFLVVFEGRGRQMCTFGVLGLSCEAPAAPKPKRAHLRVPVFKNTTKIPREDPQRGRKEPTLFGRIWPIFVDRIWPDRIWRIFYFLWGGGGPKGWGARRGGRPQGVGARTQKRWGPKGWGARRGGGPEGVGARTQKRWSTKGWGLKGWGPEISRFFFFSLSPEISFFLLSLGGSSRGILVVFETLGRSIVRVWSSRIVV